MAQVVPVWLVAMEAAEEFVDILARHRADGVVSPEEAATEARVFRTRVFPAVVDAADCLDIAQAVMRRGPEGDRAAALIRQRQRRRSDAPRFRVVAA